jgi:hypothetical protein
LIVYASFNYSGMIIKSESNLVLAVRVVSVTLLGAASYVLMLLMLKIDELNTIISLKLKVKSR